MDIIEKIDGILEGKNLKLKKGITITREKDGKRGEIDSISGDKEIIGIAWFDGSDRGFEIPVDKIRSGKYTLGDK